MHWVDLIVFFDVRCIAPLWICSVLPIRMNSAFLSFTLIIQKIFSWDSLPRTMLINIHPHYSDVIMNAMASQITGVSIVYSTVCLGADQRKYQSSASLGFVWGIHQWPVKSPHKGPVTRKMFPFNDVIMLGVFQYTWRSLELSFDALVYSRMVHPRWRICEEIWVRN